MHRVLLLAPLALAACGSAEPIDLLAFDEVVFYDGYAEPVDDPPPAPVVRLSNTRVARRLTAEELDGIGERLALDITIGALCDNYDRLANASLAFVPAGLETYTDEDAERIEIGRFITPFMHRHRDPTTVDYHFELDPLASVLADRGRRDSVDTWIELDVFGVPYAAQEEIAGCADRIDTFTGTLTLSSPEGETDAEPFDQVVPIAYHAPFNTYTEGATDSLGQPRKTFTYTLAEDAEAVQVVLVVSNHGANAGGEEYERRGHNLSVDGTRVLQFTPGRTSCEPFREVNTQPNGIYGAEPRTDAEWQSFSNWCPGDVIDTRRVDVGPQSAGEHTIVLGVPEARFVDDQGNFPVSLHVLTR